MKNHNYVLLFIFMLKNKKFQLNYSLIFLDFIYRMFLDEIYFKVGLAKILAEYFLLFSFLFLQF